jgi:hypothetical protein
VALQFVYSCEWRGGQRQRTVRWRRSEVQGGDVARPEEGDDLGKWAKWAGSAEWTGLATGLAKGFWVKIKDLNRWASDLIFELISGILSLKSKVSNISNWILN